ncbi:hypothetical protein [Mycobacterium marinum]|uniref:hypothetical protein n=1 Tax=Mycobacterium marinum TaxID=1781 RepID=UPI000CD962EC|nr:hypothetical protein [Mycobacterium marinum]AXN50950.1 hypothetical protein CCUG20998_03548 [Mycobacterium marinum]RFZ25452.1 hypothetical protein DSM43519_01638 [Mycobacterium marinum]RFZ28339.1 hypothetical protein DSM44344_01384 [Mycobacterium marinum]RFZ33834.1 hypothetical protein NCTC2275_02680 [Mycobacterium marinum]WOR03001.1 hypothetical protein QDR78_17465 [Mycobacterium marinum]
MATRKSTAATPSAGARLIAELARDGYPFSLTFLIEQAAVTADHLEYLNAILRGDRDVWLQLKLGAKTVEVVVNNVLVQRRQQSLALSRLLSDIARQRAAIDDDPNEDDPTAV